jgi:hypothetical protein
LLQETPVKEANPRTSAGTERSQVRTSPETPGPTTPASPRHGSKPASDLRAPRAARSSGALRSIGMTLRSMAQRREALGPRLRGNQMEFGGN